MFLCFLVFLLAIEAFFIVASESVCPFEMFPSLFHRHIDDIAIGHSDFLAWSNIASGHKVGAEIGIVTDWSDIRSTTVIDETGQNVEEHNILAHFGKRN